VPRAVPEGDRLRTAARPSQGDSRRLRGDRGLELPPISLEVFGCLCGFSCAAMMPASWMIPNNSSKPTRFAARLNSGVS